nr:prephenate dehydrogenase/arogenate dehydrogenase family protein [Streptomyces sp. HNM0574]
MLAGLLAASGWETVAVDASPPSGEPAAGAAGHPRVLHADVTAAPPGVREELARADVVCVAVPERTALAALDVLERHTAPHALVVETLSHKARFQAAAEQRLAPRPLLSLNPLFHPSLGWRGNTVTVSGVREDTAAHALLELIDGAGARVHRMSHADHDRCVTSVQAVTHAAVLGFAQALPRLGLSPQDVAACAAPPTRTLLALAARLLTADPETYWDIQDSGAGADAARTALRGSLAHLDETVGAGGEDAFRALFGELRDWFDGHLDGSAEDAAALFRTLLDHGGTDP